MVPAGSFSGEVPVEIHCTPDMSDSSFVVHIKLVPNEDFPLAGFDNRYFELSMTNQLVKPKNWGNLGFLFWSTIFYKLVPFYSECVECIIHSLSFSSRGG